jgi:transposase
MRHSTLMPDAAELSLEYLKTDRQSVTAVVRTSCVQAACPRCHCFSKRIHRHYDRKLADLPWNGIPVHIRLHPGIEIISRDRTSVYAEAARKAASAAVQVADRWHLLRNLSDALEGVLESKHALLAQGAKAVSAPLLLDAPNSEHQSAE